MHNEWIIKVTIDQGMDNKMLGYNFTMSEFELEQALPARLSPLDPSDLHEMHKRQEFRKRLVDNLSAKIALALTDAMINQRRP